MGRKLGQLISLNGRLSQLQHQSAPPSEPSLTASTTSLTTLLAADSTITSSTSHGNDEQVRVLYDYLSELRFELALKDKMLRRLRDEQEAQLSSLCRQMMSFECGLRNKERELRAELRHRENLIRQQDGIIRFLLRKSNLSKVNVDSLETEAVAKIPNVQIDGDDDVAAQNVTTIRLSGEMSGHDDDEEQENKKGVKEANDDSDSAIILVDMESPTSTASSKSITRLKRSRMVKRISRSVSDVVSASTLDEEDEEEEGEEDDDEEEEEEDVLTSSSFSSSTSSADHEEFRRLLVRQGSFERYKMTDQRHSHSLGHARSRLHQPQPPHLVINHRSVTKPRDVKNRSSKARSAKSAKNAGAMTKSRSYDLS